MTIEADFVTDIANTHRRKLLELGFSVDPAMSNKEVLIAFYNMELRSVAPRPRLVKRSHEFPCPDEHKDAVDRLEGIFTRGENVNPYLSKGLKVLGRPDQLMQHWSINHAHLGELKPGRQFSERTGPLLFFKAEQDTVYFIGVLNHGCWGSQDLIEIVHRNWPEILAPYRASTISNLSPAWNDNKTRIELRRAGLELATQMADGTVYLMVGGGTNSAGGSARAIRQADYTMMRVRDFEQTVRERENQLREAAHRRGLTAEKVMKLRFQIASDLKAASAVDHKAGVQYFLVSEKMVIARPCSQPQRISLHLL